MNVIFTLDNIVLVPIVSRIIAKDCGGMQDKDLLFMSSIKYVERAGRVIITLLVTTVLNKYVTNLTNLGTYK